MEQQKLFWGCSSPKMRHWYIYSLQMRMGCFSFAFACALSGLNWPRSKLGARVVCGTAHQSGAVRKNETFQSTGCRSKNEGARQAREKWKRGWREPENYQWTDFPALWPCSRLNGTPFHNGPFTQEIKEQVSMDGIPGQWVALVQTSIMYTHGSS